MTEYVSIPEERIRILKREREWRKQLRKFTDAKIELDGEVAIDCKDPFMLMRVVLVIKAFGRGFSFDDALYLLDESYALEVVDIRGFSGGSKERQATLRGRIIGKEGIIKAMLEKRCDARIAVHGKTVAVICKALDMARTLEAIEMILSGSKFGTVSRFLKQKPR